MSTASTMYALSINDTVHSILLNGHKRTVLVQGHMGSGKSSILSMLAKALPNHIPCYFDCTTKDLGDITIPDVMSLDSGAKCVTYVPNEEFGLHTGKPVILMLDEFGKSNPAVKNALMRPMLERTMGSYHFPNGSIVFATTNLGAEGVGDLLLPHQRNRVSIQTMRKPDAIEWITWGLDNDIDPVVMGWVRDNPHVMDSFEDHPNPEDNPYIYHPKSNRAAFVTPRSLEGASDWTKLVGKLSNEALTAQLIGTMGDRGALDLMAYVNLSADLPKLQQIKDDPANAPVPKSIAATCMVVFRTLQSIDNTWVNSWFTYLERLDTEAQALFINGVRNEHYSQAKRDMVMTSKVFGTWLQKFGYLFGADVR